MIVCCGQTGAGKSSFINKLCPLNLKTSPISDSLGRGVHTTRDVSLYEIDDYYNGGEIKFGIDDSGKVVGIKNAEQKRIDIENKIKSS